MIVVPAGTFLMGSLPDEPGHQAFEQPAHQVTIAGPFAVAKFELSFADWDTCAANGTCDADIKDSGFGRGPQPVINVTWGDATRYRHGWQN
ncbi:MAG TPA: SUMF1/EgtB/PvdO family nonheme iron enzyme [Bradyrhizobium sp.]|nr:SUMF1/EgtB/PvdO family nonheme iron enzyme [Bradyrhizobium sp.]